MSKWLSGRRNAGWSYKAVFLSQSLMFAEVTNACFELRFFMCMKGFVTPKTPTFSLLS